MAGTAPRSTRTSPRHHRPGLIWAERFFRDVTDTIGEGSFTSVRELAGTIKAILADRNANPKRYVWTAKGEDILRKIHSPRMALQKCKAIREILR